MSFCPLALNCYCPSLSPSLREQFFRLLAQMIKWLAVQLIDRVAAY